MLLPPLVDHHLQKNEEGFEVHVPPFGPGCGAGGGEMRVFTGYAPARTGGLARAHALLVGTIRNTGKRGANRWNCASGASLSIGMCALALVARFR